MALPKSWTTVTPLSKTIAMILFIFLPFIGFSAGMKYQQKLDQIQKFNYYQNVTPTPYPTPTTAYSQTISPTIEQKACIQDVKQCSDGTWVGRTGPNCEFICPKR